MSVRTGARYDELAKITRKTNGRCSMLPGRKCPVTIQGLTGSGLTGSLPKGVHLRKRMERNLQRRRHRDSCCEGVASPMGSAHQPEHHFMVAYSIPSGIVWSVNLYSLWFLFPFRSSRFSLYILVR